MATFQFATANHPYGVDNTQRRIMTYGYATIQPDTAGGSTYTYVAGGIRAQWVPTQAIKAQTMMPEWVTMVSLKSHNLYVWTPGAIITNVAVASTTVTVTCANNFQVGDRVKLVGLAPPVPALNNMTVTVVTATASSFTASLGVANLASTAVNGIARPIRYYTPPPTVPGQNPLVPAPQGSVMILSAAGAEISAGAIPAANTGDLVLARGEFVRSYQ